MTDADLDALARETEYAPDGLETCCAGALVRRITETKHYVLNHTPTAPVGTRVFYECDNCGRRLQEGGHA